MRILIAGDSWACGAYTNEKENSARNANFTHKPIQVLKPLLENDSHDVFIACNPGGNDKGSLINVKKNIKNDIDLVIFYKTCTLRSVELSGIKKLGLQGAIDNFNNWLYRELEKLPMRVFLIGGLDKIAEHVDVDYVLESLPEFLLKEPFPKHSGGRDFFDNFKNWYNYNEVTFEDLELANNLMMDSIKMHRVFADNQDYFPDLGHPGKKSTELFYELIKEKI